MTSEHQKVQPPTAGQLLNYFEQGCLSYRHLTDPRACQNILEFKATLSNARRAKFTALRKIVDAIKASHTIEIDSEDSLNAALWLCLQPEVEKLTVLRLKSDLFFERLVKTSSKTKIEFSDLVISPKIFADYLKSRPEPLFIRIDSDGRIPSQYKYLSELPLSDVTTLSVRSNPEGKTVFYVNGTIDNLGQTLNGFLEARSDECHVTFLNGGFLPSVNVAHPNVCEIDFAHQYMTKQHLYVWLNIPNRQLRVVSAAACTFDSPETRSIFLEALLKRQQFTRLRLINCGFVEPHFQMIKTYAEQHPELVAIELGPNPLSAETCSAIQKQVERNAIMSGFKSRLIKLMETNVKDIVEFDKEVEELLAMAQQNRFDPADISRLEHKRVEFYFSRLAEVKEISEALALVAKLEQNAIVAPERKYDIFLWLAHFYFKSATKTEGIELEMVKYLSSIPAGDSRYSESEARSKELFFNMIERILLSDKEVSTTFQEQFIRDLQSAVHNPKDSLESMMVLIENFSRDASMFPLFKEHVKNKDDKIKALASLCPIIKLGVRKPVASAPPADAPAAEARGTFDFVPVAYHPGALADQQRRADAAPVFQSAVPPRVTPYAEERAYMDSLFKNLNLNNYATS